MDSKKIENLISLLDDDNASSAGMVMAELLSHGDEINGVLKNFQETDNANLRRRIHQLESIVLIRQRRKTTAARMRGLDTDIIAGLTELHLLWYDNDSESDILRDWEKLVENSRSLHPDSIEKLAVFMKRGGFAAAPKDELEADYYCLGIVLEEMTGADFVLCAIAARIAALWGLQLRVTNLFGDFALMDDEGKILFPKNNWKIFPQSKKGRIREWDSRMLLRLDASMLFTCALSADSFRYVNTTGGCLAKASGLDTLDFLPYPYNCKI